MSDANEPDPVSDANEPDPVSDANEPDPVSDENEPDPVSDENEPDPVNDENEPDPVNDENEPADARVADIRVEVVRGGDPGDAVLAAVATILTRPVVVPAEAEAADDATTAPSRWRRAARLEAVVHGRRIASVAELVRHR